MSAALPMATALARDNQTRHLNARVAEQLPWHVHCSHRRAMAVRHILSLLAVGVSACAATPSSSPPPGCGGKCDSPNPGVQEVPLISLFDGLEYAAQITLGGNQTFTVMLDSGSTTLAVAGASCTTCTGISPLYVAGPDAVDEQQTAMTTYEDNSSFAGEIFQDSMQFTGTSPAISFDFVAISSQHAFFSGNTIQGLLGLGPANLADPGTSSYMGSLMSAGIDPVLAFQLCPRRGRLWIGGFDATYAASPPQFTEMLPISPDYTGYFTTMTDIGIGGTSLGFDATHIKPALIDTGTAYLVVPGPIKKALTAAVQSSPGYQQIFGSQTFAQGQQGCIEPLTAVTDAEINAALPPLTLTFPGQDGAPFTLTLAPTQSYILNYSGTYCLAVQSIAGYDGTILGDMILRAFITIVDQASNRVGFAPEIGCAI
jgi:hypothetical protein